MAKSQRVSVIVFGLLTVAGGGAAVFSTDNQAGSTALLLIGAVSFLVGLTGRVPDRIGKEGVAYEIADPGAHAVGNTLEDQSIPLTIREAIAREIEEEFERRSAEPSARNVIIPPSQVELAATAKGVLRESGTLQLVRKLIPNDAELAVNVKFGKIEFDALMFGKNEQIPTPRNSVVIEIVYHLSFGGIFQDFARLMNTGPRALLYVAASSTGSIGPYIKWFDEQRSNYGIVNARLIVLDPNSAAAGVPALAAAIDEVWRRFRSLEGPED